jgi:penicillin-binding protein 1A
MSSVSLDKNYCTPYPCPMSPLKKRRVSLRIILILSIATALIVGVTVGYGIASTKNVQLIENFGEYQPALPSQILDSNGKLITEFFSEEKREIVPFDEIPKNLIYAVITKEDQDFYDHRGFSFRGMARAVWFQISGGYFSGGSTITQQISGILYADRTEISIKRKLKELWWAIQMERSLSKNEILETYLNTVYLGSGTYGIEAASQFYFQHSARELSMAESAIIACLLNAPATNSPINHPNRVQKIQWEVLTQMVEQNYTTMDEVELSFTEYWNNYDYTRTNTTSATTEREDNAPYFSEYVRQQLEETLYGSIDIYKDGFIVHTTLNSEYQETADSIMAKGLSVINATYRSNSSRRIGYMEEKFVPLIDLLSLTFNVDSIRVAGTKQQQRAKNYFQEKINPSLDMVSLLFGLEELKFVSKMSYSLKKMEAEKTTVEGALITIDNDTGHILAMVGGSQFESINQFNRAVQSNVMPGSAFKPLYYSAAIDSRKLTTSTLIYDSPVVFWNDDGSPYTPLNYKGEWKGPVLLRYALIHSMNVPSLKVLDTIGLDAAIDRASLLLGVSGAEDIARIFPRKYPLGLGIIRIAPIQMAKAYAVFANQGREVLPVAIRYIEDRNGRIILEPEKDLRDQQRKKGDAIQLISEDTAYIMANLLQSVVRAGTLNWARINAGDFPMPMAGKTGTTQNWEDAWTVGFSPYVTTAIWFGFDQPGNSLGINQSGAVAAGPVWAEYMKTIHENLDPKEFPDHGPGVIEVTVCSKSGLLPTQNCNEGTFEEIYLKGTEPTRLCDVHEFQNNQHTVLTDRLYDSLLIEDLSDIEQAYTDPDDILTDFSIDLNIYIDPDLNLDIDGSLTTPLYVDENVWDSGDDLDNPFLD